MGSLSTGSWVESLLGLKSAMSCLLQGIFSLTSRAIDFLSLKDDDDPDDSLVIAVGDVTSAYYQVPEKDECYCDPPPEWLAARAKAGLDVDVVWKLEKQLPGRRAASREWVGYAADQLLNCGFDRNEACPQFYRNPMTRLALELHMDDF